MPGSKKKSKSDRLLEAHLKRAEAHGGIYDDWKGLDAFLDAVLEEAREEQAKQEKAREKVDAKP